MFLVIDILPSIVNLNFPLPEPPNDGKTPSPSLYGCNPIGSSVPSPTLDVRIPTSGTIKSPKTVSPSSVVPVFLSPP